MKNNKNQYFPIASLREILRQRSNAPAARLSRSVGRLTSCDLLPCMEYGETELHGQGLPASGRHRPGVI